MTETRTAIPIVPSISQIAPRYDAWLCDIWGVIHNGVRPFQQACDACEKYRAEGGAVVFITNSPRPSDAVKGQLDDVGVQRAAYDDVVSSGDVARSLVASRQGRPIYHLGPERDLGIFEGLDVHLTEPADAEIVLCSGLFDDETETPDDYEPLLVELHARELPLVCANPDIVVERGEKIVYCAGSLAERYKAMGGEVIYTGKPQSVIYDLTLERLALVKGGDVPRQKVLAIGDGLKTDIPGAFNASLDAVYIASAIHVDGHNENAALDDAALMKLFDGFDQKPVAAMARLAW